MIEQHTFSPWMNTKEAAAYAKRGARFLRRQWQEGRLRAAVVGGKRELMFRREWLDSWLEDLARPVEAFNRRSPR